ALRAALARLLAATGPPVAGGTAYLVACAHRRLRRRGDALLAGVGVRIRQGGPLVVLADLGRCDQRTLARALAVTEPAAAQVVDELVRAGLVRRGRDPRDRRRWVLTLTVGGRQRAARARAAAAQVEREVAAVLGDVDAAALRALLLRVCVPSR
ncbi:MAG TPA: MarR family winged helix-turn-helix transcriptional regulator, partial [Pilimelia sp.]|nr:MarR family winged helix-turn-helix transcriptional regulator [Pilimelia sp.]